MGSRGLPRTLPGEHYYYFLSMISTQSAFYKEWVLQDGGSTYPPKPHCFDEDTVTHPRREGTGRVRECG